MSRLVKVSLRFSFYTIFVVVLVCLCWGLGHFAGSASQPEDRVHKESVFIRRKRIIQSWDSSRNDEDQFAKATFTSTIAERTLHRRTRKKIQPSLKVLRHSTTLPSTQARPSAPQITKLLSWSEVYGETDCSPNPWRVMLLDLFEEWTKMAKKHNIEYMLFYGSLLGALRTGDIIPWDSDIDLLMDVKYFPKMKKISVKRGFDRSDGKIRFVVQPEFDHNVSSNARKRYTCKGKLTPHMVDQCSFQEPFGRLVLKKLHIDFYQFYNKGDYLEDPSEDDLKKYKTKDIFPLRPCKFMGFDTFCPNKPWTALKQYFRTDNLESKYKCKNKKWQDKNGNGISNSRSRRNQRNQRNQRNRV